MMNTKSSPNTSTISAPCMCPCYNLPHIDVILLALPSTDSWIESMIKKKQKKKGNQLDPQLDSQSETDPFEELNRYLKQPRMRREDCPNPIPWWGVCVFF